MSALEGVRAYLKDLNRPGIVFYHHGVLDHSFTAQHRERVKRRLERIKAAGDPKWLARYEASAIETAR